MARCEGSSFSWMALFFGEGAVARSIGRIWAERGEGSALGVGSGVAGVGVGRGDVHGDGYNGQLRRNAVHVPIVPAVCMQCTVHRPQRRAVCSARAVHVQCSAVQCRVQCTCRTAAMLQIESAESIFSARMGSAKRLMPSSRKYLSSSCLPERSASDVPPVTRTSATVSFG